MNAPRPVRRTPATAARDSVNNMMVRRLMAGQGNSVRDLQAMGMRFDDQLDLTHLNAGQNPDDSFDRNTLWRWSHKAPVAEGVQAWWAQVDKVLLTTPVADRCPVVLTLFRQATEVVRFGGASVLPAFLCTFDSSARWFGQAGDWTADVRDRTLLTGAGEAGDPSASFVDALWETGRWSAQDLARPVFARQWKDSLELAVGRLSPALLSVMVARTPDVAPALEIQGIPALRWLWMEWVADRNRPEMMSMEGERFARLASTFECLVRHTPVWPEGLLEAVRPHMPALQKNPQWATFASLVEQRLLGQSLDASGTPAGSATRRL